LKKTTIILLLCLVLFGSGLLFHYDGRRDDVIQIEDRYYKEIGMIPYDENTKIIGLISKYESDPFLNEIINICINDLKEEGYYPIAKSPISYTDSIGEQKRILQEFIISEVDGIVIIPDHDIALNDLISDASLKEIPVVIVDTPINTSNLISRGADISEISFVVIDNYMAAYSALNNYITESQKNENCIILAGDLSNENARNRLEGFLDAIESSNFDLVDIIECDWQENEAYNRIVDVIESDVEFSMIISSNDRMAMGALSALKEYNLDENIKLSGFDATGDGLEALRNGDLEFNVYQNPKEFGNMAIEVLEELMSESSELYHYIASQYITVGDTNEKDD